MAANETKKQKDAADKARQAEENSSRKQKQNSRRKQKG